MTDTKWLIMTISLIIIGAVIILFSIPKQQEVKQCYVCDDLGYDSIGMQQIVKTNCYEVKCK